MEEFLETLPIPASVRSMLVMPYYIGSFVQSWGKLERACIFAICDLREDSDYEQERFKFLKLTISDQAKSVGSAVAVHYPKWAEIISTEYNELGIIRNDIVHGFWNEVDDSGTMYVKRVDRKNTNQKTVEIDIKKIASYVKIVDSLALDLLFIKLHFLGKDTSGFSSRFEKIPSC